MRFLPICILISLGFFSPAQSFELSGSVSEGGTGKPLPGVNLILKEKPLGTSTDADGHFYLQLPAGIYHLELSFVGYRSVQKTVDLQSDLVLDFKLVPAQQQLADVEVSASPISDEPPKANTVNLSAKEIKAVPAILGEPDPLKVLQLMPGVQGGTEGTSGFYVRGGSPDQNLVLLDGVPVYNVSHLFGFFSVFNADVVEEAELLKGGFPARYGGRLSSVLNVKLRDGDLQEFKGSGALSIVSPKLLLEGPIEKGRSSFLVSGRRSIYDLVAAPFFDQASRLNYYFGDLNLRLKQLIGESDQLILSYFHSADRFKYRYDDLPTYGEKSGINWKNHTVAARWQHSFNQKFSSLLTTSFNFYRFNTYSEQSDSGEVFSLDYRSQIQDMGFRYDLQYQLSPTHHLRFGTGHTYHTFRPGALQLAQDVGAVKTSQEQNLSKPIFSHEIFAYAEDTWRVSQRWKLNGGLHFNLYEVQNTTYPSLQPRFSAQYLVSDRWTLHASYSKMTQNLHLLSNTGLGLPTDLWVSATDKVKPQQSQQVAMGSNWGFYQKSWELSTEVYYKSMKNLIEYKEGASYLTLTDWQNVVETNGTGQAYGLEVLLRKKTGNTTGWVAYTLARTQRTFKNLNQGKTFPYRYDRRHNVSVVLNHKFNKKIDLSATWIFQSGIAFTAPTAAYLTRIAIGSYAIGGYSGLYPVENLSERNAYRYPAYHRLDLGINFRKQTKWGSRVINVSVYNAYNRVNPFFIDIKRDSKSNEPKAKVVGLFPILPSVSYSFQF